MAFNALKYVKELREVGVSQEQAEVQAKGLQLVQDDLISNFATKQDLERGLKDLETKLDTKINNLDIKINNLETKLDTKIDSVGKDLKAAQGSQTLQIIGGMAALLAIFRFLPEIFKQ